MSLIITFMFEPAKLQMNWARASGRRNLRLAAPTSSGVSARLSASGLSLTCVRSLGLRRRDGHRRADQGEVAECLWEVADLPLPRHVVLLGEQAEIVGQAEEPLEERAGLLDAAVECESAHEPERAGEELPFVAGQPVVGLRGRVAGDETVAAELP